MTESTTTFIDTNELPKVKTPEGEVREILNEQLVGAKNVHGSLRWLSPGEKFTPEVLDRHQLLYLMDGKGTIRLEGKDYEVGKGAGIYLGPKETATVSATAGTQVKIFHLKIPHNIPK